MPARSRHRSRLHSGSPPRAPPPPLGALHSGEARRAPDSDGGSDADSEVGPGSPTRTTEVSGGRGCSEGSWGAPAARGDRGVGAGAGGRGGQGSEGPRETVEEPGQWL